MFLQVVKNYRSNAFTYKLVSEDDIKKFHPLHMELRAWLTGPQPNSRFGMTVRGDRYIYVNTDATEDEELKNIAIKVLA